MPGLSFLRIFPYEKIPLKQDKNIKIHFRQGVTMKSANISLITLYAFSLINLYAHFKDKSLKCHFEHWAAVKIFQLLSKIHFLRRNI